MRLVTVDDSGKELMLNYMWLPTWIGINNPLKKRLEDELKPVLMGKVINDKLLDEAHDLTVDFFVKSFPKLPGLRDYLDALKFVQEP